MKRRGSEGGAGKGQKVGLSGPRKDGERRTERAREVGDRNPERPQRLRLRFALRGTRGRKRPPAREPVFTQHVAHDVLSGAVQRHTRRRSACEFAVDSRSRRRSRGLACLRGRGTSG